jgi:hypothetical protein
MLRPYEEKSWALSEFLYGIERAMVARGRVGSAR